MKSVSHFTKFRVSGHYRMGGHCIRSFGVLNLTKILYEFEFFSILATSLTRIAQSLSFSTSFLVDIVQTEVLSTPDNTLTFRGNSIATKSMEAYMKLIGETYLRETLTRFVTDIVSSKTSNDIDLEVDPGRVSNLQNLERNQITLRLLCEKIWVEIQQSHSLFPQ